MIPAPSFILAFVLALTLAEPVHSEPAAAIVIELPEGSVIATTTSSPPSAAELAAAEWGRDAVSAAQSAGASSIVVPTSKPQLDRLETIPLPAGLPIPAPAIAPAVALWKSSVVSRLEQNKKYPPEAASRREHGVAQVFFSIDRQGRLLESRVVRPSGVAVLDDEALAMLKRAEPYPPPPPEVPGKDRVDLTVPIRFNMTQTATPQPASPTPSVRDGVTYATHHKHVPSGKSRAIGSLMGAYPDCTPWGNAETEAAVIKAPEHGTVEIVPGQTFASFTDPLRAKCNGKKMPTMLVNYKSAKGYVGPDEFVVFATFVHGVASEMTFKMNVR